MARLFSTKDAKRLIRTHKDLKRKLSNSKSYKDNYRHEITKASENLVGLLPKNIVHF